MLNAAGDSLRGRLNDAITRRGLPMIVTGRGSMMAVHPGSTAPTSPPESAKRSRQLIDLMHLTLPPAGISTARRGLAVLSLPHCAPRAPRFTAPPQTAPHP